MAKVDWVSYTYQAHDPLDGERRAALPILVLESLPEYLRTCGLAQRNPVKRRGFSYSINLDDQIYIFGSYQGTVLVEHTGRGCDWLRDNDLLDFVLATFASNLSRLDIAADYATTTEPRDVVCRNPRMTSSGFQTSSTGTTVYHGSRKSERYARVYRYNPPHPRAHLLRIEIVGKHENARLWAERILSEGCKATFDSLAQVFDFDGMSDGLATKMGAAPEDRRTGGTVYWLYDQVAPALARVIREDAIDLHHFLEHVRSLR